MDSITKSCCSHSVIHPSVHSFIHSVHPSVHSFIHPSVLLLLHPSFHLFIKSIYCGAWWLIGRFDAFRQKGRGFESHFSRPVGTLGKSFTRSCLWHFSMKLRHSIRAVLGALLSIRVLEEAL